MSTIKRLTRFVIEKQGKSINEDCWKFYRDYVGADLYSILGTTQFAKLAEKDVLIASAINH